MPPVRISSRSIEGVLTLMQLPGVGQKTAAVLAQEYPAIDEIRRAASLARPSSVAGRAWRLLSDESHWIEAQDQARRIIEQARKLNVRILTVFDREFPPLLRSVPDCPLVLYVKGQLRDQVRNVACVGTREPSEFGTEVTRRLVSFLVEHDWGIVSGLARGIDTDAHRAALDRDGYTVAVLANGLDKVYPNENRRLAEEIVDRGGALVSEQPFGVPAKPVHLVQRDRLQCGMSVATIVMQTDLAGGSMHTVRFTLIQGRLLAVPVPPGKHAEEAKSRGLIALTESSGTSLATLLKGDEDYRQLLLRRFRDTAPALPIRSRADYPELLRTLCQRLASEEKPPANIGSRRFFEHAPTAEDVGLKAGPESD